MQDNYEDEEEDCGGDFAAPVTNLNSGYTLDYTTISIIGERKDKDKDKDDHPLSTPEPSAFLLMIIGLATIFFARRKNKRN